MNHPASFLKNSNLFVLALASFVVAGCVTVNVNFPEGAVQKATDDFVKDLYRSRDGKTDKSDKSAAPSTDAGKHSAVFPASLELITSALADDSFTVKTPKALAIQGKMRGRLDEVVAHKREGSLGETSDGLIAIHDASKVKKLQAARVQALVSEENSDRNSLYQEVLSANGLKGDKLKDLKARFGRSFQAESPSGTWLQESDGKWSQKP